MIHIWKTITHSPVLRVVVLLLFFSGIGCFVLWDYSRIDRDFRNLKDLLTDTRYQAVKDYETLVHFSPKGIVAVSQYHKVGVDFTSTGSPIRAHFWEA